MTWLVKHRGVTYEKLTSDDMKKLLSYGYATEHGTGHERRLQDLCNRTENDRKMRQHEASKKIHTAKNQRGFVFKMDDSTVLLL